MDGGTVYVETSADLRWNRVMSGVYIFIVYVKNEEKQSGSEILADVVGRAEGGLRRRRLLYSLP